MTNQVKQTIKAEIERAEQAKALGLISPDPVEFFIQNVDKFLGELNEVKK